MKFLSSILISLVLTLVLISYQNEIFAEDDSIFPQWIRQSTEIWVNGDITDAEYLALIENVLNNDILPIEIIDEKKLKHTAKMVVKDIPELSQDVDMDLIPLWTKDRAQWWVEGKITDEQFLRTIHYLRESGYLEYTPEKSYFTEEQTFQSSRRHRPFNRYEIFAKPKFLRRLRSPYVWCCYSVCNGIWGWIRQRIISRSNNILVVLYRNCA